MMYDSTTDTEKHIIEMLADWTAAVTRHADGDLMESIAINAGRFGMSDQLVQILENTIREMGWYSDSVEMAEVTV